MGRIKEELHEFQPLGSRYLCLKVFIEIYRVINFSSVLTTLYPLIMHLFEKNKLPSTQGSLNGIKNVSI